MYGREEFQLPPEITNYMRVIYAIQVGLTDEVRKCMASRLPPEYLCREIMTSQFFDELPLTIKNIIGQCRHHGYKHFSLYLIRLLMINKFISFETFDIKWILTERDKIIYRGNAGLTDTEMGKIFSVLIQIAKDLELEMKAPLDSIVAKLEYYKTCCMDERTFEWFKEGLTYIAAKEQEFGTFRNNPGMNILSMGTVSKSQYEQCDFSLLLVDKYLDQYLYANNCQLYGIPKKQVR